MTGAAGQAARPSLAVVGATGAVGTVMLDLLSTRDDGQRAMTRLQGLQASMGFESLLYDDRIGKVSLVGAGMRSNPGVTARFFSALADAGVNIEMISTSEIRISVVVDQDDVDQAVTATHTAFELDSDQVPHPWPQLQLPEYPAADGLRGRSTGGRISAPHFHDQCRS